MTKKVLIPFIQLFIVSAYAQQYTQTIKGTVTDKNLLGPIAGVLVTAGNDSTQRDITDSNGYYEIADVPVGRLKIMATHSNYAEASIANVLLTSGKELV